MVHNTVHQFVDSNVGVEIFLKEREHQKEDALKQKIGASLYTLYSGFKKIPFTLQTYVLAILQNGAKFIQKLAPSFKLGQLQTNSGKSKNLKFYRLLLSKKYICLKNTFLQLKHMQMIYLTLISTTCVKICPIICVIFETINHFSRHNHSSSFQTFH